MRVWDPADYSNDTVHVRVGVGVGTGDGEVLSWFVFHPNAAKPGCVTAL